MRGLLMISAVMALMIAIAAAAGGASSVGRVIERLESQQSGDRQAPGRIGERGPHGGEILEDKTTSFEVSISPGTGQVSVYALRGNQFPRSMSLTVFRDPFSAETIEVAAISPPEIPVPLYAGKLSFDAGSYTGLELRIGSDPHPKILRSGPR
ncbi:MAG TPA: hypothetical protein VJB59_00770 [Bdellovibrionota bacterium]|nr:hypothetical protein [Bdellovibrionota bacterium]